MLRYTRVKTCLTVGQRMFYEKNGYLLFPRLVPQDLLDKCSKRFDDIVAGIVDRGGMIVMRDVKDKKSVSKLQDIQDDEVLKEYLGYKKILDLVESITGPNIMAVHNMLIAKPPDVGFGTSKHPPHQDLYYFPFRPADRIVAAWTAMERCDEENGCLYVAPGSHKQDTLYSHDYPPGTEPGTVNKFYHGILDLPKGLILQNLVMEAGDTVLFHPLLIHGSGVNKSNRTRRAISCHYAAAECHYINIDDTVQKPIHDEILQHVKDRFPGAEVAFTDIWRMKSTLVRGMRSSL